MTRLETLHDIVEFTKLTSPHIKSIDCFEVEHEQRIKLEVRLSFWYKLFFGRSYIRHLTDHSLPRLLLGVELKIKIL